MRERSFVQKRDGARRPRASRRDQASTNDLMSTKDRVLAIDHVLDRDRKLTIDRVSDQSLRTIKESTDYKRQDQQMNAGFKLSKRMLATSTADAGN